jgi:hypothetical protein
LKPSRRNSVTSVTQGRPGSGAWKSWVPSAPSGRLAGLGGGLPAVAAVAGPPAHLGRLARDEALLAHDRPHDLLRDDDRRLLIALA